MPNLKLLIVANWKMNPLTFKEAKFLFDSVKKRIKNIKGVQVVICPPFPFILNLKSKILNPKLGAQDCFWKEKGAFTGEVSPAMLKNLGAEYVIIGHSERRALGETNEMVNKKIMAALKNELEPILCIDKISQIKKDLKEKIIIAYEPLFAIGTGKPCSIEKAKKMRTSLIRFKTVLYGGSVNSENAKDYIEKAGFQGLLVGGASLNPKEFIKLVKNIAKLDLIKNL
jgi:triosephosphate isomerase